MKIKFEDVKNDETIRVYIEKADRTLMGMGFTEHSFPHVTHVASVAGKILKELEYSKHDIEIARIAGYMHDIGNVVNRHDPRADGRADGDAHSRSHGHGKREDIAAVITAIGNHDEPNAYPVDRCHCCDHHCRQNGRAPDARAQQRLGHIRQTRPRQFRRQAEHGEGERPPSSRRR